MDLVEQEIKRRVGYYLREIRKKRGLDIGDIALALGKSKSWVCDVEHGRRGGSRLSADIVASWCAYMDIPVSAVAERQRKPEKNSIDNSQRFRSYVRILRNRMRSKRIYGAMVELKELLQARHEDLTPAQTRELLASVAKNVEIIDTSLAYQR